MCAASSQNRSHAEASIIFTTWRATCKPDWLPAVSPWVCDHLDTLEELVAPLPHPDKYAFLGQLLRESKRLGLLSFEEHTHLQEAIVGPRGWL